MANFQSQVHNVPVQGPSPIQTLSDQELQVALFETIEEFYNVYQANRVNSAANFLLEGELNRACNAILSELRRRGRGHLDIAVVDGYTFMLSDYFKNGMSSGTTLSYSGNTVTAMTTGTCNSLSDYYRNNRNNGNVSSGSGFKNYKEYGLFGLFEKNSLEDIALKLGVAAIAGYATYKAVSYLIQAFFGENN